MLPRARNPKPSTKYLKPEGTQILEFHSLFSASPSFVTEDFEVEFYTDGSCPENTNVSFLNPAGWAFTFREFSHLTDWVDSNGSVVTNPEDDRYVGSEVGSNNVAELQAILVRSLGLYFAH
jgi:hypothetical protein